MIMISGQTRSTMIEITYILLLLCMFDNMHWRLLVKYHVQQTYCSKLYLKMGCSQAAIGMGFLWIENLLHFAVLFHWFQETCMDAKA